MARDKPTGMQLAGAKCITYLYRAGAVSADDPKILYKTLPVLVSVGKYSSLSWFRVLRRRLLFSKVYLCQENYSWQERVEAAETLAHLTEINVELQRLASISNHLIIVLTSFVNYKIDPSLPNAKADEVRKELTQAAFRVSSSSFF